MMLLGHWIFIRVLFFFKKCFSMFSKAIFRFFNGFHMVFLQGLKFVWRILEGLFYKCVFFDKGFYLTDFVKGFSSGFFCNGFLQGFFKVLNFYHLF